MPRVLWVSNIDRSSRLRISGLERWRGEEAQVNGIPKVYSSERSICGRIDMQHRNKKLITSSASSPPLVLNGRNRDKRRERWGLTPETVGIEQIRVRKGSERKRGSERRSLLVRPSGRAEGVP